MEAEKKYAETYGGKVGGILPLLGMIAAIAVLHHAISHFHCGRYPVTDPNGRPPGGWPGLSCESGQYPTCHYPLRDLRTVCGNVHCDGQLGGRPLGHDAHAVPNGCADGLSRRPSPGCHLFRLRVR